MKIRLVLLCAILGGCANNAALSLRSEPAGAYITQGGKPVKSEVLYFPKTALDTHKTADNCWLVKGFKAEWASGASKESGPIRLCGEKSSYQYVFTRPEHPGLDKDIEIALRTEQIKLQKQANDIAAVNAISATLQPQTKNCQTTYSLKTAYTQCQ